MKKYIDVKSKKVYNEGDLYTFVKECKECGVYCKNITKFTINDDTLKLAEGRLEKVENEKNPVKSELSREEIKGLFAGFFKAIEKYDYKPFFNRMLKLNPKGAMSYIVKEIALGVEHIMNYKGHIKDFENPYFIHFQVNESFTKVKFMVKSWEEFKSAHSPKMSLPYKFGAFFRDKKIAEYVAEETCNIFNSILNENGKQKDKKRK